MFWGNLSHNKQLKRWLWHWRFWGQGIVYCKREKYGLGDWRADNGTLCAEMTTSISSQHCMHAICPTSRSRVCDFSSWMWASLILFWLCECDAIIYWEFLSLAWRDLMISSFALGTQPSSEEDHTILLEQLTTQISHTERCHMEHNSLLSLNSQHQGTEYNSEAILDLPFLIQLHGAQWTILAVMFNFNKSVWLDQRGPDIWSNILGVLVRVFRGNINT